MKGNPVPRHGTLDPSVGEGRRLALWLAVALVIAPPLTNAQGLGLDLSEPEEEEPADTAPEPEVASDELTVEDLAEEPLPTGETGARLERVLTRDDRVKSVQKKLYLKVGRFELAPAFTVSINDPYYTKVGAALRASYFLADNLAVGGRVAWLETFPTDDVRTAKRTFFSRLLFSVPRLSATGGFEWSPVYGKVAIFNSILHFDGYLYGGAGSIFTESSILGAGPPSLAADLGVGLRFVVRDFLAVNVGFVDTFYVDRPVGTTKAATQNLLTLNAGVSLFWPLSSTGREQE